MDPLEQRLTDAGEAWRRSQRPPTEIGGFAIATRAPSWGGAVRALVGIAAALALIAGAIALSPGGRTGTPGASPSPFLLTQAAPARPAGIASPVPPSVVPDITEQYADGLPRTFDAQHVYRPADVLRNPPAGEFLLGGWDAGSLAVMCPDQAPGTSIACPLFEGVADSRGGRSVMPMSLGNTPWSGGPGFVVRAMANPAITCYSNPPGGCPGPSVTALERLWVGDPATDLQSPRTGSTAPAWWSGRDNSFCVSPAAYRLHRIVTWLGPCMGVFFDEPTPVTMTVGDRLDLHLFEQRADGTPVYTVPGTTNGEVIDVSATTDPSTVTYLAKAPGTATLITFGLCIDANPSAGTDPAETNGACPVLAVTVASPP